MDIYLRHLSLTTSRYTSLYLRIALAAAFLTSVTDRFGIWGRPGTMNVACGDMAHFMAYAAKLNPWFLNGMIPGCSVVCHRSRKESAGDQMRNIQGRVRSLIAHLPWAPRSPVYSLSFF